MLVVPDNGGDDEDPNAVDHGGQRRQSAESGDERRGGLLSGIERGEFWEGGVEGLSVCLFLRDRNVSESLMHRRG